MPETAVAPRPSTQDTQLPPTLEELAAQVARGDPETYGKDGSYPMFPTGKSDEEPDRDALQNWTRTEAQKYMAKNIEEPPSRGFGALVKNWLGRMFRGRR